MNLGLRPSLHSLQARLALAIGLLALACALAGGALVYDASYAQSLRTSVATLDAMGRAVERTAAIGAYSQDAVLIQEIADGLARNPVVDGVEVQTDRVRVTAPAGAQPQPASAPEPAMVRTGLPRDAVIALSNPFDPREQVGTLRIRTNAAALASEARQRASWLALLLMAQVLVVVLLLHVLVRHMVTRPLRELAQNLRRITPGTADRITLAHRHPHDEIGVLVRSGNNLLDAMESAINAERLLHADVLAMEEQYRRIFDSSSAGIFVLDARGRLIDCNPTTRRLVGNSRSERDWLVKGCDFIAACFKDPAEVHALATQSRAVGRACAADLELVPANHRVRWVHGLVTVSLRPAASGFGNDEIIEGVIYDVTARREAEVAARHRADHDPLTGLLNRSALVHRVAAACPPHWALLYLDLDGFKQVNDTLGHHAGDEVLRQCALRIQAAVRRGSDWIARVGGDEFIVVMPGVEPDSPVLAHTAAAVLAALQQPFALAGAPATRLGVSIGLACAPRHGATWEAVERAADAAMYAVKHHGKGALALAWPAAGATPQHPAPAAAQEEAGHAAWDESPVLAPAT